MPHYLNALEEKFNYTFYKIFKKDSECYIGSTLNIKDRIINHRYDCNNEFSKKGNKNIKYNYKLYKYIRENGGFKSFEFEILDTKYCSKEYANIYESELMKKHNASLNVCKNYTVESKKEQQREYKREKKKQAINITINITINLPQN